MLTRDQLAKIANKNHISLGSQERDYIQHIFISLLYKKTQELVFKGGTALRIAYNFERYSEDLDFNSRLSSTEVKKPLFETVKSLGGFGVKAEFRKVKVFVENGERGITGDISYEGPLFTGKSASKGKVRVDVSLRGEEVEAKKIVVAPKYDDVSQFVITALTLDEIFAEKVRALIIRGKPRDLYDVWVLLESGVKIDKSLINKKLKLYKKSFDFEELQARVGDSRGEWERDLRELLPQIAPFDEVEKAVVEIFKNRSNLNGRSK